MLSLKSAQILCIKVVRHWTVSTYKRKTAKKTINVPNWTGLSVAKEENVGTLLMFTVVHGPKKDPSLIVKKREIV